MNVFREGKSPGEIIEEYYRKFRYDCLHIAFSILKDQERAEDAVHDAFEAALKHKIQYSALLPENFRKLILVIVKNKCLDMLRRNKRELPMEGWMPRESDIENDVEEQAIKDAEIQRMIRCVETLDEKKQKNFDVALCDEFILSGNRGGHGYEGENGGSKDCPRKKENPNLDGWEKAK